MNSISNTLIVCFVSLSLADLLHGQVAVANLSKTDVTKGKSVGVPLSEGQDYLNAAKLDSKGNLGKQLREDLNDPETLNHYLIDVMKNSSDLKQFVNDANLKFTTVSGDSGNESSLGISWDYSRTSNLGYGISEDTVPESEAVLSFNTRGMVAFDSNANPSDLSSANVDLSWVFRRGGIVGHPSPEVEAKMDRAFREWQDSDCEDQTRLSEYSSLALSQLGDEFYGKIGANLGFETDQSFDNYQWTFGAQMYLDVKGWNTASQLSRCNIFDYPAALLRWILPGVDDSFTPRGSTIPTVILGLDYVDPMEAGSKVRGGDERGFFRFKAEAATRSPIAEVLGETIFLEGSLRFFQELGASSAIEALGQDQQLLATVALVTAKGWYVSYSTGELPFD